MSTVKESAPSSRATIGDLAKVEGKAELIDGRVVNLMPTGYLPNRVAFRIARAWTIMLMPNQPCPAGVSL